MLVKCKDTYQAAWFLMNGASFLSLEKRTVKGSSFHQKWVISMLDVTQTAIDEWAHHTAEGRIREYAEARIKLKRLIKKYENRNSR